MKFSNFKFHISNLRSEISNRRGFTLLEVSVAGVLLAVLMAAAVQMLGWVAAERRALERRQWAMQEAANVMERITARPWESLSPDPDPDPDRESGSLASVELSSHARDVLPEAELHVTVADEPEQPDAKRLVVVVRWQRRPGEPAAQVRLTSWVYRRGGSKK